MKYALLTSLLVAFTCCVDAQVNYFDDQSNFESYLSRNAKQCKLIAANHITHLKGYTYSKKHVNGLLCVDETYDSQGNIIENTGYTKHGKMKYHFKYRYNDNGHMTASTSYSKNGKPSWGVIFTYDKAGHRIGQDSWWKDSVHNTYKYFARYNSAGNIAQSKSYDRKGKLIDSTDYAYYDDGSKKKTAVYNSKGKITAVWNYDCNPIGKLQESKMKDTSKICVHYETDKNGNPVKIKEEYTEGGKLFKCRLRKISKYDKNNHLIEQITTKMNGKEQSHWTADYNTEGNEAEWIAYEPNSTTIKKRRVFTYDNSGNMTQLTVYNNSSAQGSVVKYVYN